MRLFEIEKPGVEDRVGGDIGMVGLDDPGVRIQAADDLARRIGALGPASATLLRITTSANSIWSVSR
jgi:hypothetical protein